MLKETLDTDVNPGVSSRALPACNDVDVLVRADRKSVV